MCDMINISYDFFRWESVQELPFFIIFFLFRIWNKFVYEKILLYSQLSLTKHLFKTDHPRLVLPPPPPPRHCLVIGCNYALYKTETSLRRITDTFKTVNGPLISALGNEKYLRTEM